tara:strand:- start:2432 stop:3226 length:795 start_codon:yes stop_codon:yes gene_type:complete
MRENVTIIGAGSLTLSILEGIGKSTGLYNINVVDIDRKKVSALKKFNVQFYSQYTREISKSNIIMLVTKPKDYVRVIKSIDPYISNNTIVLSFMAGIKTRQIQELLTQKIIVVRCMTNLAISVGHAFLFYFVNKSTKSLPNKLSKFLSLFASIKRCLSENNIDKLTALYGSGPAYYVFFNNVVKNTYIQMGFSKKESELYTNSLMLGSTNLIASNDSLDLLKSIASKGGTTEVALSQLKKDKVDKSVNKAIQEAYERSKKILGK